MTPGYPSNYVIDSWEPFSNMDYLNEDWYIHEDVYRKHGNFEPLIPYIWSDGLLQMYRRDDSRTHSASIAILGWWRDTIVEMKTIYHPNYELVEIFHIMPLTPNTASEYNFDVPANYMFPKRILIKETDYE